MLAVQQINGLPLDVARTRELKGAAAQFYREISIDQHGPRAVPEFLPEPAVGRKHVSEFLVDGVKGRDVVVHLFRRLGSLLTPEDMVRRRDVGRIAVRDIFERGDRLSDLDAMMKITGLAP